MDTTKKKILGYLFILIGTISLTIMSVNTYFNQPMYTVNQYINCIKNGKFQEAASFISYNKTDPLLTQEELSNYIEAYFSQEKLKDIRKVEKIFIQTQENKYCYKIDYLFENQTSTAYLELIKKDGAWQIIFPFKKQDIYVFAPLGSSVFLDENKLSYIKEGVYKAPYVLEGKHRVKVEYPVKGQASTTYTIDVPQITEINIDYIPHQVVVEAAKGMIVELAGLKQESTKGEVTFDYVMAGDYTLEVYDKAGNIIPIEKSISVEKNQERIKIDTLQLSELGHTRMKTFMADFYKAYREGIQKADDSFFTKYTQLENTSTLQKLFNEWFIEHKDISDVRMQIELGDVIVQPNGKMKLEVFENVELVNQEEGKRDRVVYQINLNWVTSLVWDNENYSIDNRIIDQSIIAYKDKDGKWIQY